ncbi:MbcA/ParS/Xre antitoxin family protein [soil metagenome]
MANPERETAATRDTVVTKALLRAADALGLSQKELARVVGVSEATMSRIATQRRKASAPVTLVSVDRKEGELALLVLRVFRSLDALVGGDAQKVRAWFAAPNTHLGGIPKERIQSAEGLVTVAMYLDGMRGNL